jgi:hypothetical protein
MRFRYILSIYEHSSHILKHTVIHYQPTQNFTDSGAIKETFFFYKKPFCKIILALIYINVHGNAWYNWNVVESGVKA